MFDPYLDKETIYKLTLIFLDLFIDKYKEMCIYAAQYARENKDFIPVYKTCIIYSKQHFERMKKYKEKKHEFLQEGFIQ